MVEGMDTRSTVDGRGDGYQINNSRKGMKVIFSAGRTADKSTAATD
jgi:hypothetical protein